MFKATRESDHKLLTKQLLVWSLWRNRVVNSQSKYKKFESYINPLKSKRVGGCWSDK